MNWFFSIEKLNFSQGSDHRSSRSSKDSHHNRDSHRDEKPPRSSANGSSSNSSSAAAAAAAATTDRAFKEKHHPLLIAIWNTDRTQTNVDEKLKGLRDLIRKGTSKNKRKSFSSENNIFFRW